MKQIFLSLITFFVLSSCSSDAPQEPATINNPIKQNEIVGLWADGDSFVSFNSDGYYAAYLADDYLESGTYKLPMEIKEGELHVHQEDSIIEIRGCLGYTILQVLEINSNTIKLNFVKNQNNQITLHKTNRTPVTHTISLVGQTYNGIKFVDEYTAIAADSTSNLNYILYENRLYLKGDSISIWELSFDNDGNITTHIVIA